MCRSASLSDADINAAYSVEFATPETFQVWLSANATKGTADNASDISQWLQENKLRDRFIWKDLIADAVHAELEKTLNSKSAQRLIGRQTLLDRALAFSSRDAKSPAIVYFWGSMGSGKSALAATLAVQLRIELQRKTGGDVAIFSFDFREEADVELVQFRLFDAMYARSGEIALSKNLDTVQRAISLALRRRPAIVILENFEYLQNSRKDDPDDFGRVRRPFPNLVSLLSGRSHWTKLVITHPWPPADQAGAAARGE